MSLIVLLDTGPLGLITNPRGSTEADTCNRWLEGLLNSWAEDRKKGRPTADDKALDGDVILAAQAVLANQPDKEVEVVVATTNVGHLSRFIRASQWEEISL